MSDTRRWPAYFCAAAAVLLWGTSFVASKVALRSLSPLSLVAGRGLLGLATVAAALPFGRPRRPESPRPFDSSRTALLGFIGVPVHLALQAYALTMTSAVHSGWLIALNPVFTAILAAAFLRERFPALKTAGVALGFSGALVVIWGGAGSLRLPSTRGDLLILISSLNWAAYTLLTREISVRRRPLPLTFRALAVGTAVSVGIWVAAGDPAELARASVESWVALAFLGVGCTGVGYLVWSLALERLEAGTLSSFQYVQPLVTAGVAAVWIGEATGKAVLLGGGLVLAGVALVQRSAARGTVQG
ncbi:MAG: DMT family transporter [Acidobacteriia bacterium]|nr:DMT family transporter [Terriglobia bacterium]